MNIVLQGFGNFWDLIANSGPVAMAVFLILIFFSILSWSVILRKWLFFRQAESESHEFVQVFRKNSGLSDIYRECDRFQHSPLAGVFKSGFRQLSGLRSVLRDSSRPEWTLRALASLERTLQKASQAEMTTLESSLQWLATTAAVTPFIGLFGTVVGIINAFQGLGQGVGTTIQAVAPGISEALVATAAGLFAAIPAVIFYNQFVGRLKVFGAEMDDFSTEVLDTVERSLIGIDSAGQGTGRT